MTATFRAFPGLTISCFSLRHEPDTHYLNVVLVLQLEAQGVVDNLRRQLSRMVDAIRTHVKSGVSDTPAILGVSIAKLESRESMAGVIIYW